MADGNLELNVNMQVDKKATSNVANEIMKVATNVTKVADSAATKATLDIVKRVNSGMATVAKEAQTTSNEVGKSLSNSATNATYKYGELAKELADLSGQLRDTKIEGLLTDEEVARTTKRIEQIKKEMDAIAHPKKRTPITEIITTDDNIFTQLNMELSNLQKRVKNSDLGIKVLSEKEYIAALQRIDDIKSHLKNLKSAATVGDTTMLVSKQDQSEMDRYLEKVQRAKDIRERITNFKSNGEGFVSLAEVNQATKTLQWLESEIDKFNAKLSKTTPLENMANSINKMRSAWSNMSGAEKFAKINSNVRNAANAVSQFGKNCAKSFSSAIKKVQHLVSQIKKIGKSSRSSANDMEKGFKKALNMTMRLAFGVRGMFMLLRRLRTAFIAAFKDLATQSPEMNAILSEFVTALNQLKGSLATAFSPIVEVVVPILTKLMGALNSAMEAIGNFFGALTGKSVYKYTAAQTDLADSLDKTKKNAKAAKGELAGFDKLNNMSSDTDSSSDSSSGGGGTYEKVDVDPNSAISQFAQMIKDAWKKADFFDVGAFLGEKLKAGLESVYNWINTKGKALAEKLGKSFATLINGFVQVKGLANTIGKTVASAINTGLTFLNTFFKTTNWFNVGKFIADTIMGFINEVDWGLLGETLANKLLAGIDTWRGFIQNIKFDDIGLKIGEAIKKFFKTMGEVDEESELNGWQKLAQDISLTITGFSDMIITALDEVPWDNVGTAIGNLIGGIDWGKIVWNLALLAGSLCTAIAQAISSWKQTEPISASIAEMIGAAFVGIKIATIITKAAPVLAGLFGSEGVFAIVINGAGTLKEALTLIFGSVATTITGVVSLVGGIVLAVTSFFDMLTNGFSWLKEILMVVGIALAAIGAVILFSIPGAVAAIVAAVVAAVATIVIVVKDNWEAICDALKKAWEWLKDLGKKLWSDIKWVISKIWAGIKIYIGLILTGVQDVIAGIYTSIVVHVGVILSVVNGFINGALGLLKGLWSGVTTIFDGLRDVLLGINTFIKGAFTGDWKTAWQGVSQVLDGIMKALFGVLKTPINGIIGLFNGMISGVVAGINLVIEALNQIKVTVPSWVPKIGGSQFGFDIPKLTPYQIPMLAKGAVIPPNAPFMAMLGDQKNGTNIEAPLDTIKQAVAEVIQEISIKAEFDVQGDPNGLFKVVQKQASSYNARTGKHAFV